MKKHDVFISYKSEDMEMASWVRSVLETNGVACWMAPADIPGGSSYAVEIPIAIQSCRVLVLILSDNAQKSKWIPRELDAAINAGKTVMPFMVENIPLKDDFNFYLSNVQRYSAYESKTKAAEKMIAEIKAILNADVPDAAPIKEETHLKTKPKFPLWGWIALAAVLLGAAIFLLPRLLNQPAARPAAMAVEPAATREPSCHIQLTAPDTMNVRDFNKAKPILQERLRIFADGREYSMEEVDDTIDLLLPVSAFAGLPVENVLRCYLSRAINFSFFDKDTRANIPLARKDIVSVTLKEGAIPGIDATEYNIESETYQYIEFVISDDYAAAHGAEINGWKAAFLAQDAEQSTYFYYPVFPAGDGRAWYLLNNDLGGSFSELVAYNMSHDPLPQSFYYSADLNTLISWEAPAASAASGKNQCLPEEITEASVTFTLRTAEQLSSGQKIDTEAVLKTRLDSIGAPYAFGDMAGQNGQYYGVRIDMGHMGQAVMNLLAEKYKLTVRAGLNTCDMYLSDLELIPLEGDAPGFVLKYRDDYYAKDTEAQKLAYLAEAARKDDGMLYIGTKQFPLFALPADALDGASMPVSLLCEVVDSRLTTRPLTADDLWLRSLTAALLKKEALPSAMYQDGYLLNPGPDGMLPEAAQMGVRCLDDYQSLLAAIHADAPDATISHQTDSGKNQLVVFLHLPVDDALTQKGPELAQKAYEALHFEQLWADSMVVCLIDEDNSVNERARIIFNKHISSIYSVGGDTPPEEGLCYVYGIMKRGRVDGFGEKMLEVIEKMEFYQSLTDKEWTSWEV